MRRAAPLLLILLAACQPQDIFRTNAKPRVQDVSDLTGAEIYAENCAACHGDDAKGGVYPSAPGLTKLTAKHGGTFPTRYVMSTIDGYAKGTQRGPMPEFGALLDSEMEVWVDEKGVMTPTPAALVRLAEYLESVQD
ncbi:cytochrome c [Aliiroseovarius sp. S1123]|uniref:c-type cytochrome n=1 Tax=unclassified Aliiroseovarius TaxID=2623558 RepID=UPI001FF50BF3|nr:cytochrome c [Aliiroseovarius sp. S1123]MCK0171972.1 cytochrome c [Aliiroseovarius sp. S1123]